jgi:hypothetical protein
MTMQEVLNRVNDIIDNHNHHELDLLRSDLEDDIIWERKMRKYKRNDKLKLNKIKPKKMKKQKFPDYQCTGDEVI